jgi:transketolase
MEIGKELGLIEGKATRDAFGEALRDIGAENSQIVVVDGDVSNSTRTGVFGDAFPERFFNLGIAESNMVSVASGLTASGKVAVVSSFAVFLLANAYDQIRMGVAFPNLNVKLVGSHSGISIGEDGPSQMAIEDIGLAASFPNFTVLVPADEPSTRAATRAMIQHSGPVYLRTGRPKVPIIYTNPSMDFQIGKANWLREIQSQQKPALTIIACGMMVAAALDAAHVLESQGIEAQVLDMHTIKPIDVESIRISAEETGAIVTAEEHLVGSGLGAAVARVVAETHPVPIEMVGIKDTYAQSGAPRDLIEAYGLTSDEIIKAAQRVLERKKR